LRPAQKTVSDAVLSTLPRVRVGGTSNAGKRLLTVVSELHRSIMHKDISTGHTYQSLITSHI